LFLARRYLSAALAIAITLATGLGSLRAESAQYGLPVDSGSEAQNAGVTQSVGRTESALDNAVGESINSTLEWELLRDNYFHTREQARYAAAAWIEDDDCQRRHSTDGMRGSIDYEHDCAQRGSTAPDNHPRAA
jgi:putative transposase